MLSQISWAAISFQQVAHRLASSFESKRLRASQPFIEWWRNMPDFRIELSHFPDRTLAWEWVTYNPQDVESTMHAGGAHYAGPAAALKAAEACMQNRAANDRWQ